MIIIAERFVNLFFHLKLQNHMTFIIVWWESLHRVIDLVVHLWNYWDIFSHLFCNVRASEISFFSFSKSFFFFFSSTTQNAAHSMGRVQICTFKSAFTQHWKEKQKLKFCFFERFFEHFSFFRDCMEIFSCLPLKVFDLKQ